MWHWLSLMNFINLTNECLYYFFVINNMTICKLVVKFVVSLTSLIKKCTTFKEKYNFINIWTFNHGKWAIFLMRNFVFGWALGLGLGPALLHTAGLSNRQRNALYWKQPYIPRWGKGHYSVGKSNLFLSCTFVSDTACTHRFCIISDNVFNLSLDSLYQCLWWHNLCMAC